METPEWGQTFESEQTCDLCVSYGVWAGRALTFCGQAIAGNPVLSTEHCGRVWMGSPGTHNSTATLLLQYWRMPLAGKTPSSVTGRQHNESAVADWISLLVHITHLAWNIISGNFLSGDLSCPWRSWLKFGPAQEPLALWCSVNYFCI